MKILTAVAAVLLLLAMGATAEAACMYPQAPQSLPNGATATKDEMLTAQGSVKEYVKAVQETYLACLDQEKASSVAALDSMDPEYSQKKTALEAITAKKHNSALDELEAFVARWNAEKKAFTDKNSGK
jgi:hypothetical protein